MRNRMLLRGCFYGLGLYLLPVPAFLLIGTAAGIGTGFLLPLLAALLLGIGIHRMNPRYRLLCVALSMAVCFGLALWTAGGAADSGWKWAGAAFIALAAALYPRYAGPVLSGKAFQVVWCAGLAVCGGAWFLSSLTGLQDAVILVRRFTWIYCVYMVFALIFGSLREGISDGHEPSRSMLLKNIGAGAVWTALFMLLTHIPQVSAALKACLDALIRAVQWLMSLIRLGSTEPSGQGGAPESGGFGFESQETNWLMKLLEKVIYVIGIALAVLALAALLWLIGKAFRRACRYLRARLRAYMEAVNESYEDHVESLLDWGEVKRDIQQRREKRRQVRKDRVPWERLTPREQVRRSYRNYLIRHPDVTAQRTARQTLPEERQADIYEAARYSSREITPEEAREMKAL